MKETQNVNLLDTQSALNIFFGEKDKVVWRGQNYIFAWKMTTDSRIKA